MKFADRVERVDDTLIVRGIGYSQQPYVVEITSPEKSALWAEHLRLKKYRRSTFVEPGRPRQ